MSMTVERADTPATDTARSDVATDTTRSDSDDDETRGVH